MEVIRLPQSETSLVLPRNPVSQRLLRVRAILFCWVQYYMEKAKCTSVRPKFKFDFRIVVEVGNRISLSI